MYINAILNDPSPLCESLIRLYINVSYIIYISRAIISTVLFRFIHLSFDDLWRETIKYFTSQALPTNLTHLDNPSNPLLSSNPNNNSKTNKSNNSHLLLRQALKEAGKGLVSVSAPCVACAECDRHVAHVSWHVRYDPQEGLPPPSKPYFIHPSSLSLSLSFVLFCIFSGIIRSPGYIPEYPKKSFVSCCIVCVHLSRTVVLQRLLERVLPGRDRDIETEYLLLIFRYIYIYICIY